MAAINILGAVSTSSNLTIPSPFGGLSGSTIESSMGSEGSTKHSPSALSYLLFTSSVIVVGNVWCIVLSVFSHLSSYSALTVHLATGNIVVKFYPDYILLLCLLGQSAPGGWCVVKAMRCFAENPLVTSLNLCVFLSTW